MSSIFTYSGMAAKVRAMSGQLISSKEFQEMVSFTTVSEALDYLKRHSGYDDVFADNDEYLHRGDIEQRLTLSLYQDYARLYRFATIKQRRFLDFYFMHFEIDIIKKCLRNSMAHNPVPLGLSMFQDFFDKHSGLDLVKLSASESLEEFISHLQGSIYYEVLSRLEKEDKVSQFQYETALDLMYFSYIWKAKDRHLTKSEAENFAKCFGSKMDLLNLQWIYRSKQYFHMEPGVLRQLLIPVSYRLKSWQLEQLILCTSVDEFYTLLENTYYGARLSSLDLEEEGNLEYLYPILLNSIYRKTSKKKPYSCACLNSYLYHKEAEIHKIITMIESIRYAVSLEETRGRGMHCD